MEDKLLRTEQQLNRKQMEIEGLKIQTLTLNQEKLEASSLCKAFYEQSIIYYNNQKAYENEFMKTIQSSNLKIDDIAESDIKKVLEILN